MIISIISSSICFASQQLKGDQLDNYWSEIWKERKSTKENPFAVATVKYIIKNNSNQNNISILDLGCGDGRDSIFFAKKGYQVTAMDIAKHTIDELNKLDLNISAIHKDFNDLELEKNKYDIVYAHLSLHYFDDNKTSQIFHKIYKSLKPGGTFFIKCKSNKDPLYGKGEKIGQDMYKYKHIRHFFSEEYLKNKLFEFSIQSIKESSDTYAGYESSFVEGIAVKM